MKLELRKSPLESGNLSALPSAATAGRAGGFPLAADGLSVLPSAATAGRAGGFPLAAGGLSVLPLAATAGRAGGLPLAAGGLSALPSATGQAGGLPLAAGGLSVLPSAAAGRAGGLPLPATELSALPSSTTAAAGLYVHVPFCFHKCHYCDFYSITRQTPERMEKYVDLVLVEAELWGETGRKSPIQTIFFGGGTPTLLPKEAMGRLIAGLRQRLDLSAVSEFTVEANPATVDGAYCDLLLGQGVDRISFGAQSFDVSDLRVLERHHGPGDVEKSISMAKEAGFRRVNLDLIFGVPGQSYARWYETLRRAIELGTSHVSCYGLTYEPNTPLAVRRRLGQVVAAEESLELEMLRGAREVLGAAGFGAYEISNFARPGEECRHNLLYWTGGNYMGLGPSAASHLSGHRWRNRPHLGEWETAVAAGRLAGFEHEELTPRQRAGELAMLMLRLGRGVEFDDYAARAGCDAKIVFAAVLGELGARGLIEVDEKGFRLTETGLPVADAVAGEFLLADN